MVSWQRLLGFRTKQVLFLGCVSVRVLDVLLDVLSVSWYRVHDATTGGHSEGTCGFAVLFLLQAHKAAFTSNQKV